MIALAGIVSVMMLASCQKEVEIDGDVSLEKTEHWYRMAVEGTASSIEAEQRADGTYVEKSGATADTLVVNAGGVSWNDSLATNDKNRTEINTWYEGNTDSDVLYLEGILYESSKTYYFEPRNGEKCEVTVIGNPHDKKFTVSGKYRRYSEFVRFNLTFTRK